MLIDIIPFATFMFATSFSPGPNNISTMAFSMENGYKATLPYIAGIATGTFCMMTICALLSFGLSSIVPEITNMMRYFGSAYILFLAYKTSKIQFDRPAEKKGKPQFVHGALLQLVNPKAILFGMTMYSTFLVNLLENKFYLIGSSLFFAVFTFCVVSIWGTSGLLIKSLLKNKIAERIVIFIMVGALLYVAFDILMM